MMQRPSSQVRPGILLFMFLRFGIPGFRRSEKIGFDFQARSTVRPGPPATNRMCTFGRKPLAHKRGQPLRAQESTVEQLMEVNSRIEKGLTDSIKELYQHPDTQLVHRERHGKPNDEILQALRNDISKDGKLMNPSAWIQRADSEDVPGRHEIRPPSKQE